MNGPGRERGLWLRTAARCVFSALLAVVGCTMGMALFVWLGMSLAPRTGPLGHCGGVAAMLLGSACGGLVAGTLVAVLWPGRRAPRTAAAGGLALIWLNLASGGFRRVFVFPFLWANVAVCFASFLITHGQVSRWRLLRAGCQRSEPIGGIQAGTGYLVSGLLGFLLCLCIMSIVSLPATSFAEAMCRAPGPGDPLGEYHARLIRLLFGSTFAGASIGGLAALVRPGDRLALATAIAGAGVAWSELSVQSLRLLSRAPYFWVAVLLFIATTLAAQRFVSLWRLRRDARSVMPA